MTTTPIPKPNEVDFVIYHNDLDGFASAWAAWKLIGDEGVEYSPVGYTTKPPEVEGKNVAIVDFSYRPDVFNEFAVKQKSIIILDHHASAKKYYQNHPNVIIDIEKSGAMISWEWFHPGDDVPTCIKYTQDYDLWQFKYPETLSFFYGTSHLKLSSKNLPVFDRLVSDLTSVVERGKHVLEYVERQVESDSKRAYKSILKPLGIPVWVFNGLPPWYSSLGNKICKEGEEKEGVDVVLIWTRVKEGEYQCSLRSIKTDVSEIASKLGGGGHKNASGFGWNKSINQLITPTSENTDSDSPVCPWCGHIEREVLDFGDVGEWECSSCEKEYILSATWKYSTVKKDDK